MKKVLTITRHRVQMLDTLAYGKVTMPIGEVALVIVESIVVVAKVSQTICVGLVLMHRFQFLIKL